MKNLHNIWIISTIIIVILFLFLVYPGQEALANVPITFQWIFRIIVFIAVFSSIIYILNELRHLRDTCQAYEENLLIKKSLKNERNFQDLNSYFKIDPEKNYYEMTHQLLKLIKSSLIAQTVFIYLYNEQEKSYVLQNFQSDIDTKLTPSFKAEGQFFREYHLSAENKLFNFDQLDETMLLYYQTHIKVGSLMLIPITLGKFIGFLGLDSIDKQAWGEEDTGLAADFTKLFSQFIMQLDTVENQKLHLDFSHDLIKLSTSQSFTFDKLTLAINESTNELTIEYIEGNETDYNIGDQAIIKGGLFEDIIQGNTIFIPDYDKAKINFRYKPDDIKTFPFNSAVGVPIKKNSEPIGGLILESYVTSNFTNGDLKNLEMVGTWAGRILSWMDEFQTAKKLATIDGLTGVMNQQSFKETLQNEIERCRRFGTNLTLLFMDLDNFKQIDDNYGHLFGDFVLKKITTIIQGSVRTIDTVARYGGDEFAVILINTDKEQCYGTADRIRSNINSFQYQKDEISVNLTMSVGMADYPADGKNMLEIIANADDAMYDAKNAGGNKVTMHR